MPRWGKFRISFDSWKLLSLDNHVLEESNEIGDVKVETDKWGPIKGGIPEEFNEKSLNIAFVDGVRRTENVVYIEDTSQPVVVEGAFVSLGAGALVLNYGRINELESSLKECTIKRYFLLREKVEIGSPKIRFSSQGGVIEFEVETANKELSPYVNELMAAMELEVARKVYEGKMADLIITDGTLHYIAKIRNYPFVGYIKKHKRIYVYPEHVEVLRKMKVGERTPIILIHSQPTMNGNNTSNLDKFTWYVKLSEGEGITSLARLEVPAEIGIDKAIKLADLTAYLIPKFSSREFNERRAPQNLIPIKYLETFLRHRLGSQSLIRRLIAQYMK
ncbi:DNA double-strand break repair nuclease NurA [Aquifex pyrophilus]